MKVVFISQLFFERPINRTYKKQTSLISVFKTHQHQYKLFQCDVYAPLIGELSVRKPTLRPLKTVHLPKTGWNITIERTSLQIIQKAFIAYTCTVNHEYTIASHIIGKGKSRMVDFMYSWRNFKGKKRNYTQFHEF